MSKTIYTIHINCDDGEGIEVSDKFVHRAIYDIQVTKGVMNPADQMIAHHILHDVFSHIEKIGGLNITDDFLTVFVKYGKEGSEKRQEIYTDNDD